MILRTVLLWAALAAPAHATQDGWPAVYDVAGVAAGDMLDVRERPDATAPVIGQLAPGAAVEVIRPNDRLTWGLVNLGERTGWVSLSLLARRPGQLDGAFPEIAACYGTEPFWNLARAGDALTFATPDTSEGLTLTARSGSENRRDRFHLIAEGAGGGMVAILRTETCADGMSDREFGISADLLLGLGGSGGDGARQLSGCCTLIDQ